MDNLNDRVMKQLSEKQLHKLIKKITIDLSETNEDSELQEQYWIALRSLDIEKILWFQNFGRSVRQQIMNISAYQNGLTFGFHDVIFGKYGWLKNDLWKSKEEIEFRIKEDTELGVCNAVRLGEGNNGKWAFGLSVLHGSYSYHGSPLTVFNKPYPSREICLDAAISVLKNELMKKIEVTTKRSDILYMEKVINAINEFTGKQAQLNIF